MMENNTTVLSSAAFAFEQRSATAVAQVAAFYDEGNTHSAVSTITSTAAPATNDSSPLSSSSSSSSSLSSPTSERLKHLDFKAAQIETDAKLAQELQRKEYRKAEAATERRQQRQPVTNASNLSSTDQYVSSSWSDWLMGTATTTTTTNETSPTAATARGARIAEPSSSVFACVAQSISTAINPKNEVVGVDSASLL